MNRPYQVGFCVSGGGRLFRATVRYAAQLGIEVAAVFAAKKDEPALGTHCNEHHIRLWTIEHADRGLFDAELTSRTAEAKLDLIVLTFNKIVPATMVDNYRGRIINMHCGLLPAFRGKTPIEEALQAGVRFLGVSMHEVDELVDHGPIISQCILGLRREDTVESIASRLYPMVEPMFLQTIAWFAEGRIEKDAAGRIWVKGARYGELPVSPAVERDFGAALS